MKLLGKTVGRMRKVKPPTYAIFASTAARLELEPERGGGKLHLCNLGDNTWLVTIDTQGSAQSSARFVISRDNLLGLAALIQKLIPL